MCAVNDILNNISFKMCRYSDLEKVCCNLDTTSIHLEYMKNIFIENTCSHACSHVCSHAYTKLTGTRDWLYMPFVNSPVSFPTATIKGDIF